MHSGQTPRSGLEVWSLQVLVLNSYRCCIVTRSLGYLQLTPRTKTNTVRSRIRIRWLRVRFVRQVFVPWTNTLSKTWGKYSSLGGIPSPTHEAGIRPMDEYPLLRMGQVFVPWTNTLSKTWGKYSSVFVPWTNTLSKTWGKYSSMDEYPCRNKGQVFVHRRITSQKHGSNTCW